MEGPLWLVPLVVAVVVVALGISSLFSYIQPPESLIYFECPVSILNEAPHLFLTYLVENLISWSSQERGLFYSAILNALAQIPLRDRSSPASVEACSE